MRGSSGKRHRELVSLAFVVAIAEQSPHGMGQELESNEKRGAAVEQGSPCFRPQVGNGLKIEGNGFLQGRENLLEGPSLDSDVEIEADRLPFAIPAFGVAMERSGGHFRVPRYELRFTLREIYRLGLYSSIWESVVIEEGTTHVP